jgi:RimJ/RimL family protein N-acetyltransferase
VILRILGPDDAEVYQALRLEGLQTSATAFGSSYVEEIDRPLQEIARRLSDEGSYIFGAFAEDGRLVGVTGLYRERRLKTQHKAFIFGMYVTPEYRGQGVGRTLIEAAISQARDLSGLRQINLTVTKSNQAAYTLYKSCGFEEFGVERKAFEIEGCSYDVAYMALHLEC